LGEDDLGEDAFCRRELAPAPIRNPPLSLPYRNAAYAEYPQKCLLRLGFGWSR
jgi:hypothetical protein